MVLILFTALAKNIKYLINHYLKFFKHYLKFKITQKFIAFAINYLLHQKSLNSCIMSVIKITMNNSLLFYFILHGWNKLSVVLWFTSSYKNFFNDDFRREKTVGDKSFSLFAIPIRCTRERRERETVINYEGEWRSCEAKFNCVRKTGWSARHKHDMAVHWRNQERCYQVRVMLPRVRSWRHRRQWSKFHTNLKAEPKQATERKKRHSNVDKAAK